MTATVLLIRHAAHVDLNRQLSGRRKGVALTDRGREQAAALGTRLAGRGLTRVECSPLERTRDTASAIAAACGLPQPSPVDALLELDMGDWTGREIHSFGDDAEWRTWNERRGTARIPGGESMREAQTRIVAHLRNVPSRETVAMVSHCDMIRAAVAYVVGLSLDNLLLFDIDPASVTGVAIGDWGAKLLWLNGKNDSGEL
ncbi:MAG: phosphoglycerate mutase family protein [Sphingomonas bacterium]|nr:phosphoglycerate mutase family protein [Sphingomonas bacterium]